MNKKNTAAAIVLLGLLLYGLLGLHRLDRPGLQYDECLFVPPLLDAPSRFAMAQLGDGGPVLMHMPYLGGLKSILMKPWLIRAGVTPVTLRAPMVLIGLAALLLTAWLAALAFGRREAALAAMLFALDPSALHHVREDWGPCALALLLRTGVLVCVVAFAKKQNARWLLAGAALAGLGLWNKADFAFFLFALMIAATLWHRPALRTVPGKTWGQALALFLLAALPAWTFWLTHGELLRWSLGAAPHPFGWLTLKYKIYALFDTLRGFYPIHNFLGEGSITTKRTLLPHLLLAGLIALPPLRRKIRETPAWTGRMLPFFITLLGVQTILLLLVPQVGGSHHYFSLVPTTHVLAAALVWLFIDHAFTTARARRIGTVLILLPLLLTSAIAVGDVELTLDRRGGAGNWSPAIDQLAAQVAAEPTARYQFLDWGMTTQLVALNGKFDYEEIFWSLALAPATSEAMEQLSTAMLDARNVFVAHDVAHTIFDQVPWRVAEKMAELKLVVENEAVIDGTDGKPLYRLFKFTPLVVEDLAQ